MSDPKVELKIQQGIRQTEDDLVTRIQQALEDRKSYGDLDPAQFRNLVRVAGTTESAEVVKNFLRYQVGRDKKWGSGKGSLAETIIRDIGSDGSKETLWAMAQEITQEAPEAEREKTLKRVWMELIRRYLGYGARYLIYLKKGGFAETENPPRGQKPLQNRQGKPLSGSAR